jgi:hypothetical protein
MVLGQMLTGVLPAQEPPNTSKTFQFNMRKDDQAKPASSGIIELNMIAPSNEYLNFFAGEIEQEFDNSSLFDPRGEFENMNMYEARLLRAEKFKEEVHKKYQKRYELHLQQQAEALRAKIRNSYEKIDLEIQELGRYNADKELFPITILGELEYINIPLNIAPSFKANLEKVRVVADRQLLGDGESYDIFNITIFHPVSNQAFLFGKQRDPLYLDAGYTQRTDDTSLEEGIPELAAEVVFEEPSGNQLLDGKEKAALQIRIKNNGKGTARKVHAMIDMEEVPQLTIRRPVAVDEIPPGGETTMSIGLEALSRIQSGEVLFKVSFTEERWFPPQPVNITIQVQGLEPPKIELASRGIEEITGNGDLIIANGEVIKVTTVLENTGELPARNIEVRAVISDPNIYPQNMGEYPLSQVIPEIAPGEQYLFQFVFSVSFRVISKELPIYLRIKDDFNLQESTLPLDLKMEENIPAAQDIRIKGVYGTIGNRKDYALLFCVSDYQNEALVDLNNPIEDAEKIAAELKEHYDFETEIVRNPTYTQIADKIQEYQEKFKVNQDNLYHPSSQLFIYFTGHGEVESEVGYFLPSDADPNRLFNTALAYDIWRTRIDQINCDHILVAVDACFSGYFFRSKFKGGGRDWGRPDELSERDQIIQDHMKRKTRQFLTSSTDEKTPDKSDFAKGILAGLRKKGHPNGILFTSQIFSDHLNKIRPTPLFDSFGQDEAASTFIFIEKNE